jgi:iron(III) transport system permease protein
LHAFRAIVAALLLALLAGPIALAVRDALQAPGGWAAWREVGRIGGLAANTLALAAGACLIAVPAGTAVALALGRVRVPGRGALRGLVLLGLFVPLSVYAVAWQVVLGTWVPPLSGGPGQVVWRPWNQGLLPAAWVHGMAALPWVAWIVSAGLRSADRGLEEDALLTGGPALVFRRVLLPRAVLASFAAAGWVGVQAATEITVTDTMLVRTFAEEVYTQFAAPSEGLTGAVAVTVPAWLAAVLLGAWLARPTVRVFDAPPQEAGRPVELRLRARTRWAVAAALWLAAGLFAALPVAALVWKAGGGGRRAGWELPYLFGELHKVLRTDGAILLSSAGSALGVGLLAAALAWPACWLAGGSRWFARFLFVLCVVLAVTPGPVAGLGLKAAIDELIDAEAWLLNWADLHPTFPPLRSALYYQPTPLPAGWAALVRLFPVAVVVIWPSLRAVPRDLLEAARLDGLGPFGEWRYVVAPLTAAAAGRAVLAVAALAMGEVSAGKLVNPPGGTAYIFRLFDQMHYGTDSTVAALCVLQLLFMTAAAILMIAVRNPVRSRDAQRSG